ncbi:MAG TPA: threonine--tRNA ligase [Candidatus Nanoarchaeia archaeon]|nr:threonine--tRNA ligase [Candidatus Nanoarchaeia archaeon]
MKILSLHCDYFNFKPLKKAIKSIKELSEEEKKKKEVNNALAILTAVEKTDKDISKTVDKLIEEIKKIAKQVNAKNIVLYPYAHLSENLSSPDMASEVLKKAQEKLSSEDYEVWRAPFGYYKEFEMKLKGHPLSELSRELKVDETSGEEEAKEGKKEEEKINPKQLLREISKAKLDTSKLDENDHRILGKQMNLFSFNDVAPGMVFWHHNGLIIYQELIEFMRELHKNSGYYEIKTPEVLDNKLWKISGHWNKYKENMFLTQYNEKDYAVKPMNCPGGMLVYKESPKSYKDLPLRVGEFGTVHRVEMSGNLGGLFRAIQFTQDDAHIFCKEEQLEEEIFGVIDLVEKVFEKGNFDFKVELSTRPEKRIGSDEIWDKAEEALKNALEKRGMAYELNKGDGAFYGPKIDFHLKDSLGRTWQCSTIQLDFAMPERFELDYTDEDNEKKRPIMLHRAIYGSLERFIGVLLEHTKGRLPTWLAPEQVRVLNFTDRNTEYAKEIKEKLKQKIPNLRISEDFSSNTVQSKVKNAELMKVPYIIVIGDKEEEAGNLAVRVRGNKKIEKYSFDDFSEKLKNEIKNREYK